MKLAVVKIGGNVIDTDVALDAFLVDFAQLPGSKILVHGGGKIATTLASKLGIASEMIEGRRVTSPEMLDLAVMVYAGLLNKRIVAGLQARKCNAIGLSGADGMAIRAHKRSAIPIDYGMVGDVEEVNSSLLKMLIDDKIVPVFCAISCDENGNLLNTNADTIASSVALAASRFADVELVYCFEKPGVLRDVNDDKSVIKTIDSLTFNNLKQQGVIAKGMLPKISNSLEAVREGVRRVVIKSSDELLNETGTVICV